MIHTQSLFFSPSPLPPTHTGETYLKALALFIEDIFNSALIDEWGRSPWYLNSLRNVKHQLPVASIGGRESSAHPTASYC